jgi:hypothetical protein
MRSTLVFGLLQTLAYQVSAVDLDISQPRELEAANFYLFALANITSDSDGRRNTDRSEYVVCAEERRELSLPAAAAGLKTMGYGRMATHRPGGVLPGGHSPSDSVKEAAAIIAWGFVKYYTGMHKSLRSFNTFLLT